MIIDKLKDLLKQHNNMISFKELVDFVARESDKTMILSESMHDVIKKRYFEFSADYRHYSCKVLVYIDVASVPEKYDMNSLLKIKDIVIIVA